MAGIETEHLVSMGNDIAANLGFHADADERIADHIRRYWAPRMRNLLLEYAAAGGQGISANLHAALEKLQAADGG